MSEHTQVTQQVPKAPLLVKERGFVPRQAGSGAGPLCLHLPLGGRGVSCSLLLHTPPCPHLQRGIHSQQAARLAQSQPESGQWRSLSAFSPGRTLWVGGVAQEQGRGVCSQSQVSLPGSRNLHGIWFGCASPREAVLGQVLPVLAQDLSIGMEWTPSFHTRISV